jgi:selenocysteine-specific translation elongation factor
MSIRHFILATAGHGTMARAPWSALTGTDPDRLPEERRGITIDLGFAI